jgi:hypothetical protein
VEPVDGWGPSHHLRDTVSWEQMREYLVHRSLYHLKEADPHAFAIPRLIGQAKASFVAVEFDEYGGGRRPLVHQQLTGILLRANHIWTVAWCSGSRRATSSKTGSLPM